MYSDSHPKLEIQFTFLGEHPICGANISVANDTDTSETASAESSVNSKDCLWEKWGKITLLMHKGKFNSTKYHNVSNKHPKAFLIFVSFSVGAYLSEVLVLGDIFISFDFTSN